MLSSHKNKNALLLGNGINLLDSSQSVSWGALLSDIKAYYNIEIDIDNEFKPFPIGFEEMLYLKGGSNTLESKLKNLKLSIRRSINSQLKGKKGYNTYHKKMSRLGYDTILTTNYDYAIEMSLVDNFKDFKSEKYALNKRETKFSLKRKYGNFGEGLPEVWHIHGELESSRNITSTSREYKEASIMIGYEHYSSYLELIQENVNGKKGKRIAENQSVISRIKNGNTQDFWTDVFFTHNLDIVGLGLDFSENHLWWLLNRRAMLMGANSLHKATKERVEINNTIKYYYPDLPDNYMININDGNALGKLIQKVNMTKRAKAIGDVLKSFNVQPVAIPCDSYTGFYDTFINEKNELFKG